MFERRLVLPKRWRTPEIACGACLALAAFMACLPHRATESLRTAWADALAPGQQIAANARTATAEAIARAGRSWTARRGGTQMAVQLANLEAENAALRRRIERLAHSRPTAPDDGMSGRRTSPLLALRLIEARLLGAFARGALERHGVIDQGTAGGVTVGGLAVEGTGELVDLGADAHIADGQRVLAGGAVWGKVIRVATHTSHVQPADDIGFRDLVQLATVQGGATTFTTRGILAGAGNGRAEIRQVEAAAPVAVGDAVFAVGDGVITEPLRYGRVSKAELAPGDSHWTVEVTLDAVARPPRVWVLQADPRTQRLAGRVMP